MIVNWKTAKFTAIAMGNNNMVMRNSTHIKIVERNILALDAQKKEQEELLAFLMAREPKLPVTEIAAQNQAAAESGEPLSDIVEGAKKHLREKKA